VVEDAPVEEGVAGELGHLEHNQDERVELHERGVEGWVHAVVEKVDFLGVNIIITILGDFDQISRFW
jgi:hypothetical protein